MHEIGLVDDIVSIINAKLKGAGKDSKVKKLNILIGELEHVTPADFEFHFRERTKGTRLENAELSFKKIIPRFKCKGCGVEFSGEEGLNGCPNCKGRVNDIIAGSGIFVGSVELE